MPSVGQGLPLSTLYAPGIPEGQRPMVVQKEDLLRSQLSSFQAGGKELCFPIPLEVGHGHMTHFGQRSVSEIDPYHLKEGIEEPA